MEENLQTQKFCKNCEKNIAAFKLLLHESDDLKITRFQMGGVDCAILSIENMVSSMQLTEQVFMPIIDFEQNGALTGDEIMRFASEKAPMSTDNIVVYDINEAALKMFSGFVLLIADGVAHGCAIGIQGYEKRAITSPLSENDLLGSQEAFTETIRINMSLIRRRLKSPDLRFEMMSAGDLSKTDICLVYMHGKAEKKMIRQIKKRLGQTGLETILGAGFVKPFLEESDGINLFSETGFTERPDVLALNLIKGHIGILIDGSPFCLLYPFMFTQAFETMDDYSTKTYYAVFIKIIRWMAFFLSVVFPGAYLAAVNYHPELLNLNLLLNLSAGEKTTIVTLFSELVVIMFLLEIMREASVRLPRAIGTAMSIAGGLIVGDTAVKSGIISSPLLIIVGITITASFVLPQLTEQITVLRLMFIFAGGFAGFFGISVCAVMALANVCSQSLSGVSFTSPLSPLRKKQIMNIIGRKNHLQMAHDKTTMRNFL